MTQKSHIEFLNRPGMCSGGFFLAGQLGKLNVGGKARGGGVYV